MPVRTARLAVGVSGAANATVVMYQCPAGRTAIVKDIRLTNGGTAGNRTIVAMHSGPTFVNAIDLSMSANQAAAPAAGFIVLEPGDQLVINTGVANSVSYYVSGTELDGVAP
jgi:hypothetical protein